jgi:hypothetical protein
LPDSPATREDHRDKEERTGTRRSCVESTGLRGFAADSRRDVDLSNIELLSTSSSRLPPILRIGAGAVESVFLSQKRKGPTSAPVSGKEEV